MSFLALPSCYKLNSRTIMSSFLSEVSRAKRAIVGTLFKLGTDYITEELLNLNHFELYIFFPSLYAVYLFSVYLSLNTGIKPLCVIKYRHEKKIITYMVYLKIYIFTYCNNSHPSASYMQVKTSG